MPSQLAVPFAGVAHAVHALGPQLLMLVFDEQRPLQSCVVTAQNDVHSVACGMQVPAQSFSGPVIGIMS